jgi:hypothetical protein
VTQKDRVPGTAVFQAAAHLLHFDCEPPMAQALLEFLVLSSRPDGQHPVHLESREGSGASQIAF